MPDRNDAALDFLSSRRSTPAKTLTTPVPDLEALSEILTIAARVPDHGMLVPWRFCVLQKPQLDKISQIAKARAIAMGKPDEAVAKAHGQFDRGHLCVAVISSPKDSEKVPQVEQVLSTGAVCVSMVNAALAMGWGAQWISGWISHDAEFAQQALGADPHEFIAGFIYFGTAPERTPMRARPDLTKLISWPHK